MEWDIVIIGAGPAGMSAAIQAAKYTLNVIVVDQQQQVGGQIFRNIDQADTSTCTALGKDYSRGKALVEQYKKSGVTSLLGATVWHLESGHVYVSHQGKSEVLSTRHILIATGAMERPVPIPGWTLPGVLGAGASDILLKSASLLPEGPVIVCGNGPLVLQSAVHLQHFNIPVAGVVLTNSFKNLFASAARFPAAILRPAYLLHGMYMGMRTIMGRNVHAAARNPVIQQDGDGLSLSFTSCTGKQRTLQGATVLLHEGVISETRITRLARLNHLWNPKQRYWHVQADSWGATNQAGISVAGDCAGVKGSDASMKLAELAALEIVHQLGHITIQERDKAANSQQLDVFRYACMQPFLDAIFSPIIDSLCPPAETIVCRCESLTAGTLQAAIKEGSYSLDGLKSQVRCGMGTCQGRMCSGGVAELIAQVHGIPLEQLAPYHAQFPLSPTRLGEIADMHIPPMGL